MIRALRAFVLAAVLVAGCASGSADAGEAEPAPESEKSEKKALPAQAVRVEVAEVQPAEARMRLRLPGEVEGSRDALLAAALGGFVERVHVDEGDRVRKGQVLARVDSALHAADLARAEAELDGARRELERARRMAGAVPQSQRDQAETRQRTAEAAHRAASVRLSRALIRAPFAGAVAELAVEPGEVASPGAPVARLVELDPAVVSLSVADRDVVTLKEGAEVRVRTDAQGEVFRGTVTHIGPAADLKTRTFTVEVEVANPDGKLLPGMIATVELGTELQGDHMLLPQHVLVTGRDGNGLFVVEDDVARWRPVELGAVMGGQVVVEEGVSPGERVVVTGHRELADGDRVLVARQGTCCTGGRVRFEER
ncbi:MAG: efflux RND transporter periplasmic adaptor subunit [Myxococcota bacterium]